MGGGHRFPYPKYVWSPSGGWWADPVNWKRNTLIYMGVSYSFLYWVYIKVEPLEKIYVPKYSQHKATSRELRPRETV